MKVSTTRFGAVDIPDEKLIRFPRGLLGFEQATEFFIINHDDDGKLRWLQAVSLPDLAFLVVDPQHFFADYVYQLRHDYLPLLSFQDGDELITAVILTVHGKGERITVNLQAPIVMNARNLQGVQIVCEEDQYTTQHQIYPPLEAVAPSYPSASEIEDRVP